MSTQATSQRGSEVTVEVSTDGQPALSLPATHELAELLDLAALVNRDTSERFNLSFSALMIAFYLGKHRISEWYRSFIAEQGADFDAILKYRQLNQKDLLALVQKSEVPFPNPEDVYPNGQRTATTSARRWLEVANGLAREQGHSRTGLRHMMLAVIFTRDFHAEDLERWRFNRSAWGLSYLKYVERDLPNDLGFSQQIYERTFPPPPNPSQQPSSERGSDTEAPVPFLAEEYRLSWAAKNILSSSSAQATQRNEPMSTSQVLLELADQGKPGRDPQWAGDFLKTSLMAQGRNFDQTKAAYGPSPSSDSSTDAVKPDSVMTQGLAWVLGRASEITVQTSGSDVISGRHLLAALILDPPRPYTLGSAQRLQEYGIDLPLLRERFYEWVRGYGDDDKAWRTVLVGTAKEPYRKVQFDADSPTGPNLLDTEQDVLAMATLVAAKDSTPPLSIGLFGDWGSGKTFFMGQLRSRISRLAKDAGDSGMMQRDLPFYKRIVQIEFNAWHYVEGNLWASMVEHILDNLRVSENQESALTLKLQQHWIEQLGFAEKTKAEADRKTEVAKTRVSTTERDLENKKKDLEDKQKEVQTLSKKSVEKAFELSGAFKVIRESLKPLGLEPLSNAALDLQSSLRQARSVLENGRSTLMPLVHAEDRKRRWVSLLIILLAAPLAAVLVGILLSSLKPAIAQISAFATGAAGLLTGLADWLRRQAEWTAKHLKEIEDAQREYDKELAAELAQTNAEKQIAEEELASARQEYNLAQLKAEQARRDKEAAESDLAAATTAHLLGQFVQDRAASTDYRKHLGVLAVVRQDFQELSRLIEEDNWRLSPDRAEDPRFAGLTKIKDLAEEQKDATTRINRIVLYIDDLDRCPPAKVVEVLQAVHLLLAFPLFVVVVGVDARWISQSLDARYRELLHVGNSDAASLLEQSFGFATSEDYLEKIFQIPLWLRTMDANGARRMIQGLLGSPSVASTVTNARSGEAKSQTEASAGVASEPVDRTATHDSRTPPNSELASKPSGATGAKGTETAPPPASREQPSQQNQTVPNLESLKVADFELQTIDDLSPLLGRSPRALKRFVNLYRFIKARLSNAEHRAFTQRTADMISDYEAVLLLLAVDTGLPRASRMFFEELTRLADWPQPVSLTIADLIKRLDQRSSANTSDWRSLRTWLTARENDERLNRGIPRMIDWVEQVSRYSFQAAPRNVKADPPAMQIADPQ
jgi:hypothetical protein